jgi:hypothetical protein
MKPLPLVCVLSLLLCSFEESTARASPEKMGVPAQSVSQDEPGARSTAVEVLRGFQTYYLEIDTIFLEHPVIEQALAKRPEFQAWGLTRTTEPGAADVIIQFTLPALTWRRALAYAGTGGLQTGDQRARRRARRCVFLQTAERRLCEATGGCRGAGRKALAAHARLKDYLHRKGWSSFFRRGSGRRLPAALRLMPPVTSPICILPARHLS